MSAREIQNAGYEYDVFVSYARNTVWDTFIKRALVPAIHSALNNALERRTRIFIDYSDINYGDNWPLKLKRAIALSITYVPVFNFEYFDHVVSRQEMCCMLKKGTDIKNRGKALETGVIFPVVVKDCTKAPDILRIIQHVPLNLKDLARTVADGDFATAILSSGKFEKLVTNITNSVERPVPVNEMWITDTWIKEAIDEYYDHLKLDPETRKRPPTMYNS